MVIGNTSEARRQRILLNRLRANAEHSRRQSDDTTVQNEGEDTSNSVESDEVVKPDAKKPKLNAQVEVASSNTIPEDEEKKPGLNIPDNEIIIANVYRYLEQEYKYLKLINNGQSLPPLAGIHRRTAEATGVDRNVVKNIVNADREGKLRRRNESE